MREVLVTQFTYCRVTLWMIALCHNVKNTLKEAGLWLSGAAHALA